LKIIGFRGKRNASTKKNIEFNTIYSEKQLENSENPLEIKKNG
jgi:hypothetical protein